MVLALPVWAEDATTPGSDAQSQQEEPLQDIVVTARRVAENLQTVPTSITAFSQQALTERGIASAFDLSKAVPGLTIDADSGNPATPAFSIRGRGQNYGAAAGSVETYFADVPLSAPFQIPTLPAQFFDLQSLQVLKGPQGTLFGRSTTGGAVLIVPQAPTDQFGGYVRVQGGTYGDFQAEGAINLPLSGEVADLRLAFFDWQRDGYMHTNTGSTDAATGAILPSQTYDSIDETDLRATLLVRPVAGLENSTIFTFHTDRNRASAGPGLNIIGLGVSNGLGAYYTPGYGTRYGDLDTDLSRPANNTWALVDTTTFDLTTHLKVKNIFGFIDASGYTNNPSDSDGTAVAAISINQLTPPRPLKNQQTTDELQLQGDSFDHRLTWIVGGLLDRTREPGGATTMNIYSWTLNFNTAFTDFEQNTVDSYGTFASFTYNLTDRVSISGGYRHSWDDVQLVSEQESGSHETLGVGTITSPLTSYQKQSQGNTYNIGIDYHPLDELMIYGGYRRGYKRGGFNPSEQDTALAGFDAETVNDFLVGLKQDFTIAGVRGRFDIEGYYDLYHGMQVSYLTTSGGGNLITVTANVPDSTFRGFDMQFTLKPASWLDVNATYSLIGAYNTKWPDMTAPGMTQDLAVNPIPYVSKNKFTITGRFHASLPNDKGELAFAPSVNYQDRFYTGPLARLLPLSEAAVLGQYDEIAHGGGLVPGYTTVDLRAEWDSILGSRVDGAVDVLNLTDRLYFLGNTGNTLNVGAQGNAYGPPRMINVEFSTKF